MRTDQALGGSSSTASMRRAAAASCYLPREHDRDGLEQKYRSDHRERVAEAHHQRLVLHRVAERDNGLLTRGCGVGHTMSHEVVGHLREPVAHFLAAERHRLA